MKLFGLLVGIATVVFCFASAAQSAEAPAGFFAADSTNTQTIRVAAVQMEGVLGHEQADLVTV